MLKINFLGDSITEGAAASREGNEFVSLVAKMTNSITRNYGVGGTRLGIVVEPSPDPRYDLYFSSRVKDMNHDADYVFVFGGTNDYGAKVKFGQIGDTTPDTFCGGVYDLIIQLLKYYRKDQIIFIPPLYREDEHIPLNRSGDNMPPRTLQEYRDALETIVKSFDIQILDIKDIVGKAENNPLIADGLHPNDKGHYLIAQLISECIEKLRRTINIYYVRHGDPTYDPDSLTELGHQQAKLTAEQLKDIPFDLVFSSPSNRAYLTASYLAKLINKDIVKLDWASEAKAFEEFVAIDKKTNSKTWVSHSEIHRQRMNKLQNDDNWYDDPLFSPTIKNGVERFKKEVDNWLLSLNIKHDRKNKTFSSIGDNPKNIVLFAHEGAGTGFLTSIMDMNYAHYVCNYTILKCCSITHIQMVLDDKTMNKIVKYNDVDHLKDL